MHTRDSKRLSQQQIPNLTNNFFIDSTTHVFDIFEH